MPQPEPIDPGKYNFLTLMNDIENGRVRLPPFQREFVWSPSEKSSISMAASIRVESFRLAVSSIGKPTGST